MSSRFLTHVLIKKHEIPHLQQDKYSKWLQVIINWKGDEDSEAILNALRDEEVLRFNDRIFHSLAANKRCLFLCWTRGRMMVGNGPLGLRCGD